MQHDPTSDDQLVRRWQAGQSREDIFAVLEGRYAPELARTFRRMGFDHETCKDLGQETLLQVFRSLDGFRRASSFRTWLHRIARTAALKRLRHHQTQKRAGQEVALDEITDPDGPPEKAFDETKEGPLAHLLAEEDRQRVRAAVDELPAADRSPPTAPLDPHRL